MSKSSDAQNFATCIKGQFVHFGQTACAGKILNANDPDQNTCDTLLEAIFFRLLTL